MISGNKAHRARMGLWMVEQDEGMIGTTILNQEIGIVGIFVEETAVLPDHAIGVFDWFDLI